MRELRVANPMTVISIFSGAAEGFASFALIKLPPETQSVFIYFVMFFPIMLVLLFFAALVFKNKCLYAPSDYSNQEHYLDAHDIQRTVSDTIDNLKSEEEESNQKTSFDWDKVKSSILQSIEKSSPELNELKIYGYLMEHKGKFFTARGLRHMLPLTKSNIDLALEGLEQKGLILKGNDPESDSSALLWGINK
jgi:DNA-binding MarR family transcriptional regulator